MIMPRRSDRAALLALAAAAEARCAPSAVASAAEVDRAATDRAVPRAGGPIDLAPCCAGYDRPCARSRRALNALLVAIGLSNGWPG